jgi:hypothetical protein
LEFIDVYLDITNLKAIIKLDKKASLAVYGINGENGVTMISLKILKKANTQDCGFVGSKNRSGSNLDQWKEGEVRIRPLCVKINGN